MCESSHFLPGLICAKVSDESIAAICAHCGCLNDQSASLVLAFNIASDHMSVSAAFQQVNTEHD